MAVDATFQSILNEIQLSNLNFTIQVTPYAAYITLKKSTLKAQEGSSPPILKKVPSPPILSLLQEAQHMIAIKNTEILELKESYEVFRAKIDDIMVENASLLDEIEKSNNALEASNNTNKSLHHKIDKLEKELFKVSDQKKLLETKVKELNMKHSNEVTHLKNEIKSIEKSNRSKEKENHDQKRILESARDTIRNLKAKISQANVCRTKLESENRKLKKQLVKKESYLKEDATLAFDTPPDASPNTVLDAATPNQSASTSQLSSFPSMVSHWSPNHYLETPQRPGSTPSMIAHVVKHPNPGSILIS